MDPIFVADFISRNVKDTPQLQAINSFSIEINTFLYNEDKIREEQRADVEIGAIIKYKEGDDKIEINKDYRRHLTT